MDSRGRALALSPNLVYILFSESEVLIVSSRKGHSGHKYCFGIFNRSLPMKESSVGKNIACHAEASNLVFVQREVENF